MGIKTEIYTHLMGKRVDFDTTVYRPYSPRKTEWKEYSLRKRQSGIIAGVRYKRNGRVDLQTSCFYGNGELIKVIKVYTHPLRNPVWVPFRFAEHLVQDYFTLRKEEESANTLRTP